MVSKKTEKGLAGGSVIRKMFVEGAELAARYGKERVYDFSLGNPATPAPVKFNQEIVRLAKEADSLTLHGYMNNAGFIEVREAVAGNLNKRFGTAFSAEDIVMTVGAAGALNITLRTILDPGDEVVVFAPYFGEYKNYIENYDGVIVESAPDPETFQPDLADFERKLTDRTKAVIINTPNNPTGVVYTEETLREIGRILSEKEAALSREIYLISDEPYRELVYDGADERFLTGYYRDTIVAYSFSKSLSLPGERIGYLAVPAEAADHDRLLAGLTLSNRILGFVNAPSLMQQAVAACLSEKTDISYYDRNRKLLYEGLAELGYSCIRPEGAFYLWMKVPGESEQAFVDQAKSYRLLLVNGSAFACEGYVRLAYCVSPDMIERSLPEFRKLAADFGVLP